jgi:hypothetical protein
MAQHKALVLFKLNSHAKMTPDRVFRVLPVQGLAVTVRLLVILLAVSQRLMKYLGTAFAQLDDTDCLRAES